MQAFSALPITSDYNPAMQTGRPAKSPRTPFGARIHAAREAAGLSQAQVAEHLGLSQNAYAMWERHTVALRPEQIERVAEVLGVTPEHLFGGSEAKRRGGPTGKLRQIFTRASQLPRDQQKHVLRVVQDALAAYEARKAS